MFDFLGVDRLGVVLLIVAVISVVIGKAIFNVYKVRAAKKKVKEDLVSYKSRGYLNTNQASRILKIAHGTVLKSIERNELKCYISESGRPRFKIEDLESFRQYVLKIGDSHRLYRQLSGNKQVNLNETELELKELQGEAAHV